MRSLWFVAVMVLVGCGPAAAPAKWKKFDLPLTAEITALYGFAANDVWAGSSQGYVFHFNGGGWTQVASGTTASIKSIWGSSANDVWFTGSSGTVLHWNGATLSSENFPSTYATVKTVRGLSSNAVYFCSTSGLWFYDTAFTEMKWSDGSSVKCADLFLQTDGVLRSMLELPSQSSTLGFFAHTSTGTASRVDSLGTMAGTYTYDSLRVLPVSPTDLWVAQSDSDTTITRYGGASGPLNLDVPESTGVRSGFVRGLNDTWVGGNEGRVAKYDGTDFEFVAAGGFDAPFISALWGMKGVMWAGGTSGWLLRRED